MPSSPGYVRDYTQERKTAHDRGEEGVGHDSANAVRNRARRKALKIGMIKPGSKEDVDHIKPFSKGGSNDASNLRARSEHDNRSYPRNSDGSMVKNEPKT